MKIKYYIAFGLVVFLLLSSVNLELFSAAKAPAPAPTPRPAPAPKPYNPPQKLPKTNNPGTGGTSDSSSGSAADMPAVLELNWQADTVSSAVNIATRDKKSVFVYFYFNKDKEDFPANYDAKFKKMSDEKYIFAKILVVTEKDKNGRVFISDENETFFKNNKLMPSCIGVALDPYGNLMDKLPPPMSAPKVMPFMDNADKKYNYILADLDNRYERADKALADIENTPDKDKQNRRLKLMPEVIKTLMGIVNSDYEGYKVIEKANAKLGEINKDSRVEYMNLMKEYAVLDVELRDPKSVTPELEKLMKTYKGLPLEQEIKDALKDIKDGKIPENVVKELEKPVAPPVSQDEPKDEHQDPPQDENYGEQHGSDNK